MVERYRAPQWFGAGGLGALCLGLAVVPLAGEAEVLAGLGAFAVGLLGVGAGAWRSRLDHLPLDMAPVLACWNGPHERQLTARAWLGRGRRVDEVQFTVRAADRELEVLSHVGPALGCFQATFPSVDGPIEVHLRCRAGGRTYEHRRTYGTDQVIEGRFAPGFERRGQVWSWRHSDWPVVRSTVG